MLDDDPLNLSDHLPVSASVSCALHHSHHSAGIKKQEPKKLKRNWSKLSRDVVRESYTATVNDKFVRINLPDSKTLSQQPSLIDSHLTKLTNILCETAEDTIPAKRFLPHLKPEWSAELSGAHAASKLAYKAWVRAGRPRNCSHPVRSKYKECKAIFRKLRRVHEKHHRDKFFQELDLNCTDPKKLFRKIRKARGNISEPTTSLLLDGHRYKDDELPNAWGSYFANLSSLPSENFDEDFRETISEEYERIVEEPPQEFSPFSMEEVEAVIAYLSLDKQLGPMTLTLNTLFMVAPYCIST